MAAPLTIENFDVSDLFILDSYASRYGLTLVKFISLEDRKPFLPIRIDGDLKVFVTKNNGSCRLWHGSRVVILKLKKSQYITCF